MSVMLELRCGGCDATATVGPLRRRFHPVNGHGGLGINLTDPVESLTPRGWIMFDPWTFCTYCDICWDVDAGFLREDAEAVNFDA